MAGGGVTARFESVVNWYHYGSNSFLQIFFGNGGEFFSFYSSTDNAAHNTYIRILGEYGLLSLLAFMLFISMVFFDTFKSKNVKILPVSAILSLCVVVITNDYYLVRDFYLIVYLSYFVSVFSCFDGGVGPCQKN